jgi:hypothetical protein
MFTRPEQSGLQPALDTSGIGYTAMTPWTATTPQPDLGQWDNAEKPRDTHITEST